MYIKECKKSGSFEKIFNISGKVSQYEGFPELSGDSISKLVGKLGIKALMRK